MGLRKMADKITAIPDAPCTLRETWELLGIKLPKASFAWNDMFSAREYLHEHGMPYMVILKFGTRLHIANITQEAPNIFGISSKTLQRRKVKGHLAFGESVTIFMAAELFQKAASFFGGEDTAVKWFKAPNRALKDNRPIDMLKDDIGRKLVEDMLGRIEHGIYE
jgi:putative toxin-antitoxin system antitoxin component (TIGR02293 family)